MHSMDIFSPHALQHRLMRVNRLHRKAVDKSMSETGLHKSQHMMLMYLSREKCSSQKNIAEHFDISPAAVAVSLKKLEADGYINRQRGENDCRFNEIEITEKGKQVVNFSHDMFVRIDEASFDGVSMQERKVFADVLEKMSENLKSLGGKDENNVV